MQRLKIPGLLFATSSVPLEFDTDGHNTTLRAADPPHGPENILALTSLHAEIFSIRADEVIGALFEARGGGLSCAS